MLIDFKSDISFNRIMYNRGDTLFVRTMAEVQIRDEMKLQCILNAVSPVDSRETRKGIVYLTRRSITRITRS